MATYAGPRYVDQAGSGDNSGDDVSNYMPLATFNTGATAGDTALMYHTAVFTTRIQPSNAGTVGNEITYQAGVLQSPVVTVAGFPGNVDLSKNYITVDGIRSTGSTSHGVYINGNNVNFLNGETDNNVRGVSIRRNASRADILLQDTDIHNNSAQGVIYFGDADNMKLERFTTERCNIYSNTLEGYRVSNEAYNSTREIHETSLIDCNIYSNLGIGHSLRINLDVTTWPTHWGYGGITTGNTVYSNGTALTKGNGIYISGLRHEEARPAYVNNNLVYDNFCGGSQLQFHNAWDILVKDNTVHSSKNWNGIDELAIFCDNHCENSKFISNDCYNCDGIAAVPNSGGAIGIWGSRNNAFIFNQISDCKDGFTYGNTAYDENNFIIFNTVYSLDNTNGDSHGVRQFGGGGGSATAVRVKNNIFSGMDYGFLAVDNQTDVSHNCWHNYAISKLSVQTTNANEVDDNPDFVSPTILPSTWDFRLQSVSPCINAGQDSVALTTDAGTGSTITVDNIELFWADVSEGITTILDVGTNYGLTLEGHNYTAGTLTFAETFTWSIGDKIQFSAARGQEATNGDIGARGYTPAPTSVSAAAGDSQITISGTVGSGIESTDLYRSESSPVTISDTKTTGVTLPHVDNTAINGTTYYYALANNTFAPDPSVLSSEVNAAPAASTGQGYTKLSIGLSLSLS